MVRFTLCLSSLPEPVIVPLTAPLTPSPLQGGFQEQYNSKPQETEDIKGIDPCSGQLTAARCVPESRRGSSYGGFWGAR